LTDILASSQEYEKVLGALKQRIRAAQLDGLRSVNREQIALYIDIRRMIVERQQGDTWGKTVVGNHSQGSSRGISGFEWILRRQSLANEELL